MTGSAPSLAVTAPAEGAILTAVTISASVAGGTETVNALEFYGNGVLIASDATAPYSTTWNATAGAYNLTARAVYAGGSVSSAGVAVTVQIDPAIDADGDGFTNDLEVAPGSDPNNQAPQPPAIYSALRGGS